MAEELTKTDIGSDPQPTQPVVENKTDNQEAQLTEAQWEIAFGHKRFKEAINKGKEADALRAQIKAAEEKAALEKGEYKTLYEKATQEKAEVEQRFKNIMLENAIIAEASKNGATDFEAVTKLIDQSLIKYSEDGKPEGIQEAVKALLETRPYLKGAVQPPSKLGASANPTGNNGAKKIWTESEVREISRDHVKWKENEKEITEAIAEGRVLKGK